MSYHLYILRCEKQYLYTGITGYLGKRLSEHANGLCKITKNRLPCELVHSEEYDSRQGAARREKEIKGWRREKKLALISSLP